MTKNVKQLGRRRPLQGARKLRPVSSDRPIEVTVCLKPSAAIRELGDHPEWEKLPQERGSLGMSEKLRADPERLRQVCKFAQERGLRVLRESKRTGSVVLEGTPSTVGKAFGVHLLDYEHEGTRYRSFEGAIQLPTRIAEGVSAVVGLEDRRLTKKKRLKTGKKTAQQVRKPAKPEVDQKRPTAPQLGDLYAFPPDFDGSGERIAIVTLRGGYYHSDLEAFFRGLGQPFPSVEDVEVAAKNKPADREGLRQVIAWFRDAFRHPERVGPPPVSLDEFDKAQRTIELTQDIELIGALAPGATIRVYFGDDKEEHLHSILERILKDRVSVVSMSFSWDESKGKSGRHLSRVEERIETLMGSASEETTFLFASGDEGSWHSPQFPASSCFGLGCGGTSLEYDLKSLRILKERVWNTWQKVGFEKLPEMARKASGGGISAEPCPKWQDYVKMPKGPKRGRGVPDVSAVADPLTSATLHIAGTTLEASGTSASAPIWAALVARINQALGRPIGFLNPCLYRLCRQQPSLLRDITKGSNGKEFYSAGKGWDLCTGLGSPHGKRLLKALRGERR